MPYTDSLNLGSAPNDGTGEPLRSAFKKLIDNDVFLNDEKTTLLEVFGTALLSEAVVNSGATLAVTNERFITSSNGDNTINLPQDPDLGRTVEVYNFGGTCTIVGQTSQGLSNTFLLKGGGNSVICRFIRDAQSNEPQWAFNPGYISTLGIKEETNLFFTNARARNAISEGSTELDYNSTTGLLTHTGLRVDKVTRPEVGGNYTIKLTDMTVLYYSDTGGGVVYFMPSGRPEDGQVFEIIDVENAASTSPLIIRGNVRDIHSGSSAGTEIQLNQDSETVRLKYFADEDIYVKL